MADLTLLGVTYENVLAELPGLTATDASQATIEEKMYNAYDLLKSGLPEFYRGMLSRVEGEYIVTSATAGQTTATLGVSGASNIKLYQTFSGSWDARTDYDKLDTAYWSESSGTITFSPGLSRNDWVVAEYDHDGTDLATCYVLQECFLQLAASLVGAKVYRETSTHEQLEGIAAMRQVADDALKEISDGVRGVPLFDDLTLYEERTPTRGATTFRINRS